VGASLCLRRCIGCGCIGGLAAAALALGPMLVPAPVGVMVGAVLETVFGVICLVMHRRWVRVG